MKELIIGERHSGKTTELIKRSVETGAHIVVPTIVMADYIVYQAERHGYSILPKPITVGQFMNYKSNETSNVVLMNDTKKYGLLIDELDFILRYIFDGFKINAATITDGGFTKITRLEDINYD